MAKQETGIYGPSKRHVWTYLPPNVSRCERCGSNFHHIADAPHGAFYCRPKPEWLRANPEDDRKER